MTPISKEQIYALPLGKKQRLFTRMIADLIIYAYSCGYELTFGDSYATTGHMTNSLHYVRLAIDLNLFKDGVYLDKSEAHTFLGEYWESKGGTWGGRFKDGNHYSLAHAGRK